jgi:hypothetical protein
MNRAILGIAAAILVGLVVAGITTNKSSSSNALSNFSTRGKAVTLSKQGQMTVKRLGAKRAYVLAQLRGVAFFRLTGGDRECFAIGRAGTPGRSFCTEGGVFPSPSVPVIVMPTVEIRKPVGVVDPPYFQNALEARAHARLLSLGGFAADAIAGLEVVRDNVTIETAPVTNNVFVFERLQGLPVAGLKVVARGADNEIMYERPI